MAIQALLVILAVLLVLLFLGLPISYAIAVSSLTAILSSIDLNVAVLTAAQRTFVGMSKFSLTAIPFFILAGNIMNQGGIAKRLVDFVMAILGKMPGALLVTNIGTNALFGAISGSASAAAAAVGSMIRDGADEQGYDPAVTAATNAASSCSGLLIPPSNALITYSLASGGTSVAALFMAGYIPGIIWALCCCVVGVLLAIKLGYKGTPGKFDWKNLGVCTLRALPSLSLIIVVIGGIIGGVFSATEGSAIAVVYALVLAFCYRSINLKSLWKIIVDSAKMSGMVVFLVGVSNILGWVMAFLQIPDAVAAALLSLTNNKYIILLIMNVILLVSGTFMDVTPAILIFTPLFLPIVQTFGMDPIHFGLVLVYNLCIGNITPPVGNTLFVDYFAEKYADCHEDTMVVSPDVGSVARARAFAQKLNMPMAIVDKRRQKANSSEVMNIIGDVRDKRVILLDDMVDTGGSLCGAAKALVEVGGAKSVTACASHGVLSGPACERLENSPIEKLYMLNTIEPPEGFHLSKLVPLSVAPIFAKGIKSIFSDSPFSVIYD